MIGYPEDAGHQALQFAFWAWLEDACNARNDLRINYPAADMYFGTLVEAPAIPEFCASWAQAHVQLESLKAPIHAIHRWMRAPLEQKARSLAEAVTRSEE